VAYRIMITLRFGVRYWREIRRNKKGSMTGFRRGGVPKKRTCFQLIVFKDLTFSLDKKNIGCPHEDDFAPTLYIVLGGG